MQGLSGTLAHAEAARLSALHHISASRIYDITRDLRPKRKPRTDKGKRIADPMEHDGLRFAFELVVANNLDIDLAIETAQLNGFEIPVSLETARRYLREHGINRQVLRNPRIPHRRFEASAPGEMFQVDFSAVKERWFDVKTRRILRVSSHEVNQNHPNANPSRIPLWKLTLVDDYSRLKFVRFAATKRLNSSHAIDFLLEAFRTLGIPKTLYSDNDSILYNKRLRRIEEVFNKAFTETGGFKMESHLPGNAKATGKVENAHQLIEKFEKLIGVKYQTPSLECLQEFAKYLSDRYNHVKHRETGEAPIIRWQSQLTVIRTPTAELLDSAFKAEIFEPVLNNDMTVRVAGLRLKVPGAQPFVSWTGQRVGIVLHPKADFFILIAPQGTEHAGNEYEIELREHAPDKAGEFKSHAETTAQRAVKSLKASAQERRRAAKKEGIDIIVPGIDTEFDRSQHVTPMPKPRIPLDANLLASLSPGSIAPSQTVGQFLTWADAMLKFIGEGLLTNSQGDKAWMRLTFGNRDEMLDTDIRSALDVRAQHAQPAQISQLRRA